jgi:ABC-2 type transport system permease protein
LAFGAAFSNQPGMSFPDMVPGLFAYANIFIIMIVAQSFSADRNEGMLRRLNTTPMAASEFMGSHLITHVITAVLQMLLVLGGALIFGFNPSTGVIGFLFAFLLMAIFALTSVGLGLITATISKSPEAATGISFVFILPQMLLGTFIPLSGPMGIVQKAMPSHYLTHALTEIFAGTPITDINILIDFAILSIVSIGIVLLGIQLFKKYGKD